MKIADAQYKCEVCGNITHHPYKMQIFVTPFNDEDNNKKRRSKTYDICEECAGINIVGTFINWFKKLWRKK